MTSALQLIPALWRDRLYGVYVLVGILIGATQAALAALPDASVPDWLTVTLAVYAYLGILFVGMAKANVTSLSGPPPAPPDPPVPGQQGAVNLWTVILLALAVLALVLLIRLLT